MTVPSRWLLMLICQNEMVVLNVDLHGLLGLYSFCFISIFLLMTLMIE